MTERAERLAGLVGGEGLVAQAELLVPELEDFLDLASAHVAVRVVLLVFARVAPEETARLEIPVVVEVPVALGVPHLLELAKCSSLCSFFVLYHFTQL